MEELNTLVKCKMDAQLKFTRFPLWSLIGLLVIVIFFGQLSQAAWAANRVNIKLAHYLIQMDLSGLDVITQGLWQEGALAERQNGLSVDPGLNVAEISTPDFGSLPSIRAHSRLAALDSRPDTVAQALEALPSRSRSLLDDFYLVSAYDRLGMAYLAVRGYTDLDSEIDARLEDSRRKSSDARDWRERLNEYLSFRLAVNRLREAKRLLRSANLTAAADIANQVLTEYPGDPFGLYYLSQAQMQLGHRNEAANTLHKLERFHFTMWDDDIWLDFPKIVSSAFQAGIFDEQTTVRMLDFLVWQEKLAEAQQLLSLIESEIPKAVHAYWYARVAQAQGSSEQATTNYLTSLDADPENAEAAACLATLYESQGRSAAAIRWWRYYLDRRPDDVAAASQLELLLQQRDRDANSHHTLFVPSRVVLVAEMLDLPAGEVTVGPDLLRDAKEKSDPVWRIEGSEGIGNLVVGPSSDVNCWPLTPTMRILGFWVDPSSSSMPVRGTFSARLSLAPEVNTLYVLSFLYRTDPDMDGISTVRLGWEPTWHIRLPATDRSWRQAIIVFDDGGVASSNPFFLVFRSYGVGSAEFAETKLSEIHTARQPQLDSYLITISGADGGP